MRIKGKVINKRRDDWKEKRLKNDLGNCVFHQNFFYFFRWLC